MLIYSPKISPRLTYVLNHIFKAILGIEYAITKDEQAFVSSLEKVKLSYGKAFEIGEVFIPKHSDILFEEGISEKNFKEFSANLKIGTENFQTFDFLTFSFLTLTRYPEYLPFKADKHGRFPYHEDDLFEWMDVEKPWVDIFAHQLKDEIVTQNPHFHFPEKASQTISTIDVDRTFKYQTINIFKLFLKTIKQFFTHKLEFTSLLNFIFKGKDVYNTFDYLQTIFKQKKVENIYFYLVGSQSQYDNPNSFKNPKHQAFIQQLAQQFTIGIHPSYQSNEEEILLKKEKETLEKTIQKTVSKSRQHYIKLSFSKTYKNLIKYGITEDYSMGFPDKCGFRAGTSHSFKWFDLEENSITNLNIHPFCVMDVSLKNYENKTADEAISAINRYKQEVEAVNGTFIPIFHNQNLTEEGEWKDWRRVFEHCF